MNRTPLFLLLALLGGCTSNDALPDAWGNFEATEVVVSSEVSGQLLQWSVDEGMLFDEGVIVGIADTLQASLQRDQLWAQIGVVRSRLAANDAQADVIREQRSITQREQARLQALFEDRAATQQQLDDVDGQIRVLDRQLQSVTSQRGTILAEIRAHESQLALIDNQLDRSIIRNPIRGTVLVSYVEAGEIVTPGKPLYRIADMETMYLRTFVSGSQLSQIRIGQQVDVRIDDAGNTLRSIPGEIAWISSRAEFTPRTIQTREERVNLVYAVRVRVPNDGSLKIGMPGELVITGVER